MNLDEIVASAHRLVKERKRDEALSLAVQAVSEYPDEMESWLLQGYLHELLQEYEAGAEDLTRAIEINDKEPHLYYSRGRYRFQFRNMSGAVEDFTKALELCDFYSNDYYRDELSFWRAEAFLKLGNKGAALRDAEGLPDDFRSWTFTLRTKHQLMADCGCY
jgi:tetratricopeptide (TPR) repeat protein